MARLIFKKPSCRLVHPVADLCLPSCMVKLIQWLDFSDGEKKSVKEMHVEMSWNRLCADDCAIKKHFMLTASFRYRLCHVLLEHRLEYLHPCLKKFRILICWRPTVASFVQHEGTIRVHHWEAVEHWEQKCSRIIKQCYPTHLLVV